MLWTTASQKVKHWNDDRGYFKRNNLSLFPPPPIEISFYAQYASSRNFYCCCSSITTSAFCRTSILRRARSPTNARASLVKTQKHRFGRLFAFIIKRCLARSNCTHVTYVTIARYSYPHRKPITIVYPGPAQYELCDWSFTNLLRTLHRQHDHQKYKSAIRWTSYKSSLSKDNSSGHRLCLIFF